jgi:hypothetical protein
MKGIIRLPSLLLILDANVIISSYELGVWSHVTRHHKIYVPSIILHSEVYYYEKPDGTIVPIDLKKQVGTSITEISCSVDDLAAFSTLFDSVIDRDIHEGEREALALLHQRSGYVFCSSDRTAIEVIGLLGLSDRGLSFERLLKSCGITKRLEPHQTEAFFQDCIRVGSIGRIQGKGLRKRPTRQ